MYVLLYRINARKIFYLIKNCGNRIISDKNVSDLEIDTCILAELNCSISFQKIAHKFGICSAGSKDFK